MHSFLFRSAMGAIIVGALLLFAMLRIIGTKEEPGQFLVATERLNEPSAEGTAMAETLAPAAHAEQEADSEVWHYDEPESTDFSEVEPLMDTEPFDTTPAPQFDEGLVAEDSGGWGGEASGY